MQKFLVLLTYVTSAFAFIDSVTTNSDLEKRTSNSTSQSTCTNQNTGDGPKIIPVYVGSKDGSQLRYFPDDIVANVSDIIEFRFMPKNHTVTESTFLEPCKPIAANASNPTRPAVKTGFVPVTGNETFIRTFRINITDTKPIWLYCGQTKGNHCQNGMVMVINKPSDPNKSLQKYREAAAQVPLVGTSSSSTVSTTVTAATTTPAAATTTPTAKTTSSTVTAATPLVSVFNGAAAPTQRPINLAAMGGLAVVGAVALL